MRKLGFALVGLFALTMAAPAQAATASEAKSDIFTMVELAGFCCFSQK